MNTHGMNLFIVEDDNLIVSKLKQYLHNKFGRNLNISIFLSGESCLREINQNTDFIVLSPMLYNKQGNAILKSIKTINSKIEVIVHNSNEAVGTAIDAYKKGATDYPIRKVTERRMFIPYIYRRVSEPIRRFKKEYGLAKFMTLIIGTFVSVGVVAFVVLRILHLKH